MFQEAFKSSPETFKNFQKTFKKFQEILEDSQEMFQEVFENSQKISPKLRVIQKVPVSQPKIIVKMFQEFQEILYQEIFYKCLHSENLDGKGWGWGWNASPIFKNTDS